MARVGDPYEPYELKSYRLVPCGGSVDSTCVGWVARVVEGVAARLCGLVTAV